MWIEGRQFAGQQSFDFISQLTAMLLAKLQITAARLRVGIGTTADRDQRDTARMILLDRLLSVAGPIAMNLIEIATQCRAMASIVGHDGKQLALLIACSQHRQAMIDRAIGLYTEAGPLAITQHTSIDSEPNLSLPPGQTSRPSRRQCLSSDFDQLLGQLDCVLINMLLMLGRKIGAKQIGGPIRQARRGMGVGSRDHHTFILKAQVLLQRFDDGPPHRGRQTTVFQGDQQGRTGSSFFFSIFAQSDRLGPEALGHFRRFCFSIAIAA